MLITTTVPFWAAIPFVAILLSIAVFPFINHRWWGKNYPYVSIGLGTLTIAIYFFLFHGYSRIWHTSRDYFSFISLLGSLFVVTGGIFIRIEGLATPLINAFLLLVGAVISNILGTTGASMLLIRPFLHLNKVRMKPYLVVFFIFIVSNVGGALTPIGDPPLFLGFLKGVPFFWVISNVWSVWTFVIALLIGVFLVFDYENHTGRDGVPLIGSRRLIVKGSYNAIFLFVILISVFLPTPWREIVMLGAAVASYVLTPKSIHKSHHFNFHPIREVAILFFGIFATMMPALDWLEANAHTLGLASPGAYYWASGSLSSFLDNAPTYLALLSASMGFTGLDVAGLLAHAPLYVKAISLGSVFFGACTYVGNGPNFMVKSVAEHSGLRCPSFLGYVLFYSIPILLPIFFLVWLIFV